MIDEKKLIEELFNKIPHTFGAPAIDWFRDLIESQPKIDDWIPCSERLPEPARRYLATVVWADGDCIVIKEVHNVLYGIDLRWHTDGIYEFEKPLDCKVTAWKPIPIPYEVKEHGQIDKIQPEPTFKACR